MLSVRQIILLDLILFILFVLLVSEYKLYFLIITFIAITYVTKEFLYKLINLSDTKRKTFFKNEFIYLLFKHYLNKQKEKKSHLQDELQKIMLINSTKDRLCLKSDLNVSLEIHLFMTKFSANLLEKWFFPYISKNDRFPKEAQSQLEMLFTDLFYSFNKIDKLEFSAQIILLFNKNFYNIAIDYFQTNKISIEDLHPAVRNGVQSEINYMRRFVQIILRKTTSNLNIDYQLVEDFIVELVGKNCVEKLVHLLANPKFIFYAISLLCNENETRSEFKKRKEKVKKSQLNEIEKEPNQFVETLNTNKSEINENFKSKNETMNRSNLNLEILNQRKLFDYESNLYEEFNEKNLLSYKASTSSEYDSDIDIIIVSLDISSTETNFEVKTSKQYTSYNVKIEYKQKLFNNSHSPIIVKNFKRRFKEFVLLQKKLEENPIYKVKFRNLF